MANVTLKRWNGSAWVELLTTPAPHSHSIADVTNLSTLLDGKVDITGDTMTGALLIAPTNITGELQLGSTTVYLKRDNSFDLSLGQNADSSGTLYATSRGDVVVSIDADNNATTNKFIVRKDTLKTGGTDLLTVLESGNVGVGTSSPSSKLTVARDNISTPVVSADIMAFGDASALLGARANTAGIEFMMGVSVANEAFLGSITNHPMSLRTGNTNRLTINTNGNIGIGTISPLNKLDVRITGGDSSDGIMVTRDDTTTVANEILGGIGFDSTDGNVPSSILEASAYMAAFAAEDHSTGDKGGYLTFGTAPIDQDQDTVSLERMRISSQGNIGIGTNNPTHKLHVVGDSLFTNGGTFFRKGSTGDMLFLGSAELASVNEMGLYENGGDRPLAVYNPDNDTIFYGGTSILSLDVLNSKVGIGTVTPSAKLEVKSDSTTVVPLIVNTLASQTANLAEFKLNTATKLVVTKDGKLQAGSGDGEIHVTTQGVRIETLADNAYTPLIVNKDDTNTSARLQEWQLATETLAFIDETGELFAPALVSISGVNYGSLGMVSGPFFNRNINDATTTLIVNNANASSTGNILDLRVEGTNVISFKKDGTLLAPSTFTIDPSGHADITGKVIILGDLQVDGTTTTINSTTLEVDDKNIVLSKGAADKAASNGAGITVDLGTDGEATFTYGSTADAFNLNKALFISDGTHTMFIDGNELSHTATDSPMYLKSSGDIYLQPNSTTQMVLLENGRVGIGTTSPDRLLSVTGTGEIFSFTSVGDVQAVGANGFLRRARGTIASPTAVLSGDVLGGFFGIGHEGTNFGGNVAAIRFLATQNYTTSAQGSSIDFSTTPNNSLSSSRAIRMTINHDGNVGIGTTTPGYKLHVSNTSNSAVWFAETDNSTTAGDDAPVMTLQNLSSTNNAWSEINFVDAAGSVTAMFGVQHVDQTNHYGDWAVFTRSASGYTEKLRVKSGGNVGIGTTTPSALLTINNGESNGAFAVQSLSTNDYIATFRDSDGENVFKASGSVAGNNLQVAFGDINDAGSAVNYKILSDKHVFSGSVGIGTSTTTLTDALTVNGSTKVGSLKINDTHLQDTATATRTSTAQFALASFASATYRSGKFLIQANQGTVGQITELLVIHDGTTAYATEYAIIKTGSTLFTTEVDISGGNVRVLITPTSATSTVFKTTYTLIGA